MSLTEPAWCSTESVVGNWPVLQGTFEKGRELLSGSLFTSSRACRREGIESDGCFHLELTFGNAYKAIFHLSYYQECNAWEGGSHPIICPL